MIARGDGNDALGVGLLSPPVLIGCLTNSCMGVMYAWSLFLLPMERDLGLSRAELSLAPSLALACFMLGMMLQKAVSTRLTLRGTALLCFSLAGGGHFLFGFWPTLTSLIIGYGMAFGTGSGLGYGFALEMAQFAKERNRSLAIGVIVSCFALSGILISSVFARAILHSSPATSFLVIGFGILLLGVFVVSKIDGSSLTPTEEIQEPAGSEVFTLRFAIMSYCFFAICFAGLLTISHISGILEEIGVPSRLLGLGAGLLNLGYIIGSIFGGRFVDWVQGRSALFFVCLLTVAALLMIRSDSFLIVCVATVFVGLCFGGSASLIPVLIGREYGISQIGRVYGKMIFSYGLAGLIAPWVGGLLYTQTGSYSVPLVVTTVLAFVGLIASIYFSFALMMKR